MSNAKFPGFEEVVLNGRKAAAFIVHKGEQQWIVIDSAAMLPVHFKRLVEIAKMGGDPMSRMRDMTLDNGQNALVHFEPLLKMIPNPELPQKEPVVDEPVDSAAEAEDKPAAKPRGRGGRKPAAAK